jgi:hypothetical protein
MEQNENKNTKKSQVVGAAVTHHVLWGKLKKFIRETIKRIILHS